MNDKDKRRERRFNYQKKKDLDKYKKNDRPRNHEFVDEDDEYERWKRRELF